MHLVHQWLLAAHIILGISALTLFWWPMLAKKGSANHKRAGRWFFNSMLLLAVSGVAMCSLVLINPAAAYGVTTLQGEKLAQFASSKRGFSAFLLLLSLLTWQTTKVAQWTGRGDHATGQLKSIGFQLTNATLVLTVLWVGYLGMQAQQSLFLAFAVISGLFAIKCLRFTRRELTGKARIVEHITASLGAAIAVFTAFFAVGGRHWLQAVLPGAWQMLPWLLPTVIGVAAMRYYQKPYQPKAAVSAPSPQHH